MTSVRRDSSLRVLFAVCVACVFFLGLYSPAQAATGTVMNTDDSGSGSLRAVIASAGGGDTIVFDPGLSGQTISLTSGAIPIDKSLTIDGPGASQLTVDAGHASRIFTVTAGNLSISGLALADGAAPDNGGAIEQLGAGSLTVAECTFTGNTAGGPGGSADESNLGHGGAIYVSPSSGPTSVSGSTFSTNAAGGPGGTGFQSGLGSGGAIWDAGQSLTVSGSAFTGNTAGGNGGTGNGGAIRVSSVSARSTSITNSTLTGNTAGGGGAAGQGGAIEVGGAVSATLASVTVDENEVGAGAGINGAAAVTANATIVSGNTGGANCDAPVASSSYSLEGPLSGDTSCGLDLPSADPELEPLADNGGPTETHALPESSPAVDAVPAAACPTSVDQRGEPRPDYDKPVCDVGAFELQGPLIAPAITSSAAATFQVGKSESVTIEASGVPRPSLSQAGALPGGVGFTDNGDGTASLSGTPAAGMEGDYLITIEASNGVSPDATQSFTLTVTAPEPADDPAPEPPGRPGDPQEPPSPRVNLSLGVEQISLRQLHRSGRLIVAASVNKAATVALAGWAKLNARARSSARRKFVRVLRQKTVRFGQAGQKRVALTLTRRGRRALRRVPRVRLVIVGTAIDRAGESTRSRAPAILTSRPRLVVSYRQEGGIGNPRPSLVVLGYRWARVTLGRCKSKFRLPRPAWQRLRVALRKADIPAIAGNYPPQRGADLITYVIKTRAGTVRVTPASQSDNEDVMRALRPLLNVLDRTVSAGERRIPPTCKSNRR